MLSSDCVSNEPWFMAKPIPRQWLEVRLYKERDQVGVAGNDEG
jgi:hypothetical protein